MFVLSSVSLQASWGLKHTHIKIKIKQQPKQSPATQSYSVLLGWQVNCMDLKGEGITMELLWLGEVL